MAFYKLVSDGVVLDAINEDTAQWVVENRNNYSTYLGKQEDAFGVLSNDGGTVWHIHEKDPFHDFPDFTDVVFEEIGEGEYKAILEELEAGRIITIDTEDPEEGGEHETGAVTALERLQKQVEALMDEKLPQPVDNSLEGTRARRIAEMSEACNAAITSGVDVMMDDGEVHHFSLKVEDQLNLISLQALFDAGQDTIPYHADGEECRFFTAAEFSRLAVAATQWKLYHESYFNNLRLWINSLEDVRDINALQYGDEIPEEFLTDVMKGLINT